MAKATVKLPDEFEGKLSRLEDKTDEIIPKVLEAGAAQILPRVKSNLQNVIGKGTAYESRATGTLARALGVSPAKKNRDGDWNIKIGLAENRPDGEVNAKLANIIEYGKSGQPPKPFLKPAANKAKADCINAMMDVMERECAAV